MTDPWTSQVGLDEQRFAELVRFCNASDNPADNRNRARLLGLTAAGVQVAPGAIIRLGSKGSIGEGCFIGLYSYINGNVQIGARTLIGPHCSVTANNHVFNPDRQDFSAPCPPEKHIIVIGEGCWLAAGAMVTAGVRVGRCNLICANAVVTRDTPDYAILAGTPATQVGRIEPQSGQYIWFSREGRS
jgi:acetyltransferase-like isoleucine patch superfamily enzyme